MATESTKTFRGKYVSDSLLLKVEDDLSLFIKTEGPGGKLVFGFTAEDRLEIIEHLMQPEDFG